MLKIGSNCTDWYSCPVGTYCYQKSNWVPGKCTPTVGPGGQCTGESGQMDIKCGFYGFCVTGRCVLPGSLPLGDTGISNEYDISSEISMLCESGFATGVNSPTNTIYCVPPPVSTHAFISKGVPADFKCEVKVFNADGSHSFITNTPLCGYN